MYDPRPITQKKWSASNEARAGFTLVELLVSMAIFTLSMGVVSQLFIFSMKAQMSLSDDAQLVNETSYNLEHISRGLRMAKKSTDATCLSAPNLNYEMPSHIYGSVTTYGIKFQSPNPAGAYDCVEYYMGYPAGAYGSKAALMENRISGGVSFDLPLTSPDVELLNFNISGTGWPQDDELQPRVTIDMRTKSQENRILNIQSTVSQRNIDVVN
jgi:prepilin-type N-terminal cleavage/methylation domain-containing protein